MGDVTVKVKIDAGAEDKVAEEFVRPLVEDLTNSTAKDVSDGAPEKTGDLAGSVEGAVDGKGKGLAGGVTIGEDYWRFVEFGTQYMNPQPFVRPAFQRLASRIR